MEALSQARQQKLQKYEDLARALSGRFTEVEEDAIVLGSLGSWDSENDKVMRPMCSRKHLKLFKKMCVLYVIRYSRDIYVEHITESDNSEQLPWLGFSHGFLQSRKANAGVIARQGPRRGY
jgi:hypothetical protein